MSPKIYEFNDISKAVSYYKVMASKLEEYSNIYKRLWYEVTMQTSNLTGCHLVTIHIGMQIEHFNDSKVS